MQTKHIQYYEKIEYSKSFANKFVPVMKTQLYWHKFRLFYVHCSTFTANLTPFQIPNLFHFHKSVATKLLTFPIWSSSLHQVLYPWILCFCLKKKLVSEYQDISKGEVSIFSVKAQLPAAAHPWHEDMHIIAKKNPDQFLLHHSRNRDTSIFGEGLQTVPFKS